MRLRSERPAVEEDERGVDFTEGLAGWIFCYDNHQELCGCVEVRCEFISVTHLIGMFEANN